MNGPTGPQAPSGGRNGHAGANGDRPVSDQEVVAGFVRSVASGQDWFLALLHAIADWTAAEEVRDSRRYRYLIGGEAFDWLLLAERLLGEAATLVPEDQRMVLLFEGQIPAGVSLSRFRDLIGPPKHRAHLNFIYGVVVEEAIQQSVLEETAKAHQNMATREGRLEEEAWQHLYGAGLPDLLLEFRSAGNLPHGEATSLEEQHEFTYWLFKRRLTKSDPARLASDTRKGLLLLHRLNSGALQWVRSEALES